MSEPSRTRPFGKSDFARLSRVHFLSCLDTDLRRPNLATGDWRYDGLLLPALREHGWTRFAAGLKAGVYGHLEKPWCLKILGMGVGDHPQDFAGHGYRHAHERRMLEAFREQGFGFQPRVQSIADSIAFLVEECGVDADQARWQCENNHILITERIVGIPFATQAGSSRPLEADIAIFDSRVLREAEHALDDLRTQLDQANRQGLLHNDPMPTNILFLEDRHGTLTARLLDFELAQNLQETSPEHVSHSVARLYAEREVPLHGTPPQHAKNLDQHILDQALGALRIMRHRVEQYENTGLDRRSVDIPFLSGMCINVGQAIASWQERTRSL